jgi:heme/copper-type cytochrome/quinol oxidase subunit 2
MKKKKTFTPKDPKRRAKAAVVGGVIHMAILAAFGLLTAFQMSMLMQNPERSVDGVPLGFEPYLLAYGLLAIAYIASVVVYNILLLMWVHRANRNAQSLSKDMDVSPGWAVGWFFVPFASLFKPFQGLDETWRVSTDPSRWKALDTPVLLRWWWGFFLVSNITGSVSNMAARAPGVGGQIAGTIIAMICFCSALVAGALGLKMIRQITSLQVSALEAAAFS